MPQKSDKPAAFSDLPKVDGRPMEGSPDGAHVDIDRVLAQVDRRLDLLADQGPASETVLDKILAAGYTRRDFLKWTSMLTAAMMLPPVFEPRVARAASLTHRVPVIWINLQDCDGNTESLLRTADPGFAEVILDTISLDYNETVMAPSGSASEKSLNDSLAKNKGQYVAVFEGSLPTGLNGGYLTIGSSGETGLSLAKRVAAGASLVMAAGTCAAFGGIPAAHPNPTGAKGVSDALGIPVVNISGCPANATNIVGTILEVVMFGNKPPLDRYGRPMWAYGHRIHDNCERRGHFDAGEYVTQWGDTAAQNGWCLFKMGCKGPYTFNNCPQVRWNQQVSWPIRAGHGCIGCAEPNFWDTMTPFEQPLSANIYGSALGIAADAKANTVGGVVLGVAAAGIVVHAGATAIRNRANPDWKDEKESEKKGFTPDGKKTPPTAPGA
ncbi:Hydrogenase small subunit [Candidatus Hydrogenisulfobacillus filiaventi]|uniref:Hydrogenase small subunit n=1 Tax=Candidatus Hydrogenisulfobacillus filiaventi TaxID=2707344 RepID=A0A6F8ZFL1_9FIRM|nr:Hydrogenase small subunit [Candidatus Hydrogenisulfobacillus filiaventi]